MIKIFMNGCCGAMGRVIGAIVKHSEEYTIVAGGDIIVPEEPLGFPVYTSLNECEEDFDVIIDFSNVKAVPAIIQFAVAKNKPLVLCTTGLDEECLSLFVEASHKIPVFKSANMSYGMNVLFELVKQATRILYPDYEIEIVEAHHRRKLDAPSGTAYMIADIINEETNNELEYVFDRHSEMKSRGHKELGISSIRGGNIVGEHEVYFIGEEEILKISHSAQKRDVFGRGALTAAKFLVGKPAGCYSMQDVVASLIG